MPLPPPDRLYPNNARNTLQKNLISAWRSVIVFECVAPQATLRVFLPKNKKTTFEYF